MADAPRRARNARRDGLGTFARMPEYARAALHRGWIDAQNRPNRWPKDYDRMTEAEQLLYEFGRLACRNLIAMGYHVPNWRGDAAGADMVHHAANLAHAHHAWPDRSRGDA